MRTKFAVLLVVVCAALAWPGQCLGYALYAADYSGRLYGLEVSPALSVTDLGLMQYQSGASLATLVRPYGLDYDAGGNLYALRTRQVTGQFSRKYYYGELYLIDPATVGDGAVADALLQPVPYLSGQMSSADGGLAFSGDGHFYATGWLNNGKVLYGELGVSAYQDLVRTNYYPLLGLEWYDDGSAYGSVLALLKPNSGPLVLEQLIINYATSGFYFTPFTSALLPADYTACGDLAVSGDTLYLSVGSAAASLLLSYDLGGGPGGSFNLLGELPGNVTGLAAPPLGPRPRAGQPRARGGGASGGGGDEAPVAALGPARGGCH